MCSEFHSGDVAMALELLKFKLREFVHGILAEFVEYPVPGLAGKDIIDVQVTVGGL